MIGWLWLLVDALATYRLARLVTTDDIFKRQRDALTKRWPVKPGRLSELVICPWCCSVYIGVAAYALTRYVPSVWVWVAVPLALSAVAGYLSERA
jgi:hypothetical protein